MLRFPAAYGNKKQRVTAKHSFERIRLNGKNILFIKNTFLAKFWIYYGMLSNTEYKMLLQHEP